MAKNKDKTVLPVKKDQPGTGESRILKKLHSTVKSTPLLLILGGSLYGATHLWTGALQDERFLLRQADAIKADELNEIPVDARTAVQSLAKEMEGRSLLSLTLLQDLEKKYRDSPWIDQTFPFVRKLPQQIVVSFKVRKPVAQIRIGDRFYRVDRSGRRLPDAGTPQTEERGLPVIHCVNLTLPAVGMTWKAEEIHNALAVLDTIQMSVIAKEVSVKSVAVKRNTYLDKSLKKRASTPLLEITTQNGAIVRWGSSNNEVQSDELLDSEKLEMIRKVLVQTEVLKTGDVVDVRTRSVCFFPAPPY